MVTWSQRRLLKCSVSVLLFRARSRVCIYLPSAPAILYVSVCFAFFSRQIFLSSEYVSLYLFYSIPSTSATAVARLI